MLKTGIRKTGRSGTDPLTAGAQEEIPTLNDYLRNLRCGGCGHNCSLLSPRCRTGSRKASQAESAYYAQYG